MKKPMWKMKKSFYRMVQLCVIGFFVGLSLLGCKNSLNKVELLRAEVTLEKTIECYDAGYKHLFNETYPYKEENKVTYLADEDTLKGKHFAYLWPASGVFSCVNALLKCTDDQKYIEMLKEKIVPGLENYYDNARYPACYQSYILQSGESDRFYDDNVWLALDFIEAYRLTGNNEYLVRSKQLWNFVLSGWDNELGGGIYWCEQKKKSKNTCSNAPAAVLAFKLFEEINDSTYFKWGLNIYKWTRANLQDVSDHLYFDNISMTGKVDQRKYTYNTGQMLQATSLLYKLTNDSSYLVEAEVIAKSAIAYFTEDFATLEGKNIRLFKKSGNWFNVIMFRGFVELYHLNNNPEYIQIFRENLEQIWNHVRDEKGLYSEDWTGYNNAENKWLLDQTSIAEFYATISQINY